MTTPPRQPPTAAPVAQPGASPPNTPSAPATPPATPTPATPAPTPTPAPAPAAPAQPEVEGGAQRPAAEAQPFSLDRDWNDEAVYNSILSGDNFVDNLSNKYNNLTYHWRLFCMPDKDFMFEGDGIVSDIKEFYARLDQYKQVIIAESGVTGYNITDVEMSSVFGDTTARGSQFTEISMKILEPNGVSFLDSLKLAAEAAGIYNYLDFFYYLELTFKGYDETGKPVLNPFGALSEAENLPNGGRWIWTVRINDIEVNLGTGGGEYKLTMIPISEHALDAEYANAVDTVIVRGETVGEFFQNLEESLNRSWKLRLALPLTHGGFVTHKFKIHGIPATPGATSINRTDEINQQLDQTPGNNTPVRNSGALLPDGEPTGVSLTPILGAIDRGNIRSDLAEIQRWGISPQQIAGMRLRPQNQDWNSIRTHQGFAIVDPQHTVTEAQQQEGIEAAPADAPDIPTANIGRGTPIVEIITEIMGVTEQAQRLARDSGGDGLQADESPEIINSKGFRECVSWHVIPEVRFDKTGDLKYDFFTNRYGRTIIWNIYPRIDQEPILSHLQIRQAFNSDGSVQRDTLTALAARGFLPKRYDYLFTGLNTEVLNFDLNFNFAWSVMLPRFSGYYHDQNLQHARVNTLTIADNAFQNVSEQYDAWRLRAEQHNRNSRTEDDPDTHTHAGEEQQEEHDRILSEQATLEDQLADRNRAYRALFDARRRAEEEIDESVRNSVLRGDFEQDYERGFVERYIDFYGTNPTNRRRRVPPVPFSFAGGDEARHEAGFGATGQWHNGRQLYGAILNQTYGPVTGRFQQIEMTIRGDPFWIGYGSYEKMIQHQHETTVDQRRLAYHMIGQNCFIFRFKYPTDVNESGNIVLKDNETVTGIYKVNRVKNMFSNGSFQQTLEAIRLPLHDLFSSIFGLNNQSDEAAAAEAEAQGDERARISLRDTQEVTDERERAALAEDQRTAAAAAAEQARRDHEEYERIVRESQSPRVRGG